MASWLLRIHTRIHTHIYIASHLSVCQYKRVKTFKMHYLYQSFSVTGKTNLQKSPIFGGSFAKNGLQLKASFVSLPPCTDFFQISILWRADFWEYVHMCILPATSVCANTDFLTFHQLCSTAALLLSWNLPPHHNTSPNTSEELYIVYKEPYISSKEPYIAWKWRREVWICLGHVLLMWFLRTEHILSIWFLRTEHILSIWFLRAQMAQRGAAGLKSRKWVLPQRCGCPKVISRLLKITGLFCKRAL